jgi:hypothetical protein
LLPPELPPPLEVPGSALVPGLVLSSVPVLPLVLPELPPSSVESGVVLGWLPVPVDVHPPLTEQSVFGGVDGMFVESCAMAKVGMASMPANKMVDANRILSSRGC